MATKNGEKAEQAPRVLTIPAEVQIAIQSGRDVFLNIMANKVESGERKLTKEETADVLRLLGSFVKTDYEGRAKVKRLGEALMVASEAMADGLKALREQATKVQAVVKDIGDLERGE